MWINSNKNVHDSLLDMDSTSLNRCETVVKAVVKSASVITWLACHKGFINQKSVKSNNLTSHHTMQFLKTLNSWDKEKNNVEVIKYLKLNTNENILMLFKQIWRRMVLAFLHFVFFRKETLRQSLMWRFLTPNP
jgi:hypothetical protein